MVRRLSRHRDGPAQRVRRTLAGNGEAHPRPISDETAQLLPDVEYITEWKDGAPLEHAKAKTKEFLAKHTSS